MNLFVFLVFNRMSLQKTTVELSVRFINGLKNYDLTKEEIESWYYCGGSHPDQDKNKKLNAQFHRHFPEQEVPSSEDFCICGHPIKENAFITDGEKLLVLGNCCVRRFLKNGTKRVCTECQSPWKGQSLICKSCRKKQPKLPQWRFS